MRILSELSAVVALDDVAYGAGEIAELRRALAKCAVLVGAREPVVGALGVSYRLGGLTEPDAMALLARDTGRRIDTSEVAAVRHLVAAVEGSPLALRQAAALVRHQGFDLVALAAAVSAAGRQAPRSSGPPDRWPPAGVPVPDGSLQPSAPGAQPVPSGPPSHAGSGGPAGGWAPPPGPAEYGSRTRGGELLEELAGSGFDAEALRLLAVLGLAEGCYLPVRLLAGMAGVADEARSVEQLTGLGFAERRGELVGLRSGAREPCRRLVRHALDPGVAYRALTAWFAARDPASAEVCPALGPATALLRHAVEQGAWSAAHRISAAVEPALCLHGHWQAWRSVLEVASEAAEHVAAPEAVAYTAHQLGTLHLLEGRPAAARAALARALDLRTRLADWEGAAVTRRTAALADPGSADPAAVAPPTAPPRRRRGVARLAATAAVLAAGVGVGAAVSNFTGDRAGDAFPAAPDGNEDPTATTGTPPAVPAAPATPDGPGPAAPAVPDGPAGPAVPSASPADAQDFAPAPHTTAPAPRARPHAAPTGPTSLPSPARRPTRISIPATSD